MIIIDIKNRRQFMGRWSLERMLDEFDENIRRFHSVNIEAIIVDADPSKEFNQ